MKIPFFKSLAFKMISIYSLIIFLSVIISFYVYSILLNTTIQKHIKEEFNYAVNITDSFISILSETSQIWLEHIIVDNELKKSSILHKSISTNELIDLKKQLRVDKRLVSADTAIILNMKADVLVELNSVFKEGMNLKYNSLIKKLFQNLEPVNMIIRENESFILYSARLIQNKDKNLGIIMMGYFINDIFLEKIKLNSKLEMALVGNSAIMSSSTWKDKGLESLPISFLEYQTLLKSEKIKKIKYRGTEYIISAKPLKNLGNNTSGSILLGYENSEVIATKEEMFYQSIYILLIILLISIIASLLFSRKIIKTLYSLQESTNKISKGEYSNLIKLKSKDEFSQLADNFNEMAITIQEKNSQLKQYTSKLEETVKKRTNELLSLNKTLEEQNISLINSNNEFKELLDSTVEAIFITKSNQIIETNKEAVNLLQLHNKSDLLNHSFLEFIESSFQKKFTEYSDFDNSFELNLIDANNKIIPAMIKIKSKKDFNEFIISVVNLTQLKQKDKILAHQSKMASMGQMIENIAHQWRQPLSIITTLASSSKMYYELDQMNEEKAIEINDNILKSSNYLSSTIDDFRNFFADDKEQITFNINQNIQVALDLLSSRLISHKVVVIKTIDEEICMKAYANEFVQIIINLINNATDAFDINEITGDRFIWITCKKESEDILLEIKDNAGGIPLDVINQIFEPYFTTKHKSIGTGIGLYMVHQLIKLRFNGDIMVKNIKNEENFCKGALFTIRLK